MTLLTDIWTGLLLGIGAYAALMVTIFVLQTIAMVAEGRSLADAIPRSAGRTWGVVLATGTLITVFVTTSTGIVDVATNSVASAPIAASNLVTLALGLLGIQGVLSSRAVVIGALAFIGITVLTKEVRG